MGKLVDEHLGCRAVMMMALQWAELKKETPKFDKVPSVSHMLGVLHAS